MDEPCAVRPVEQVARPGSVWTALLVTAGLLAACSPPPVNNTRFWDEEATRRAPDADSPDPGSGGSDVDPTDRGGAGGDLPGGGGSPSDGGRADANQGGAGGGGGVRGNDAGTRTSDAAAAADAAVGPVTGCTLEVALTTVTANGDFAPRNVGAVWIARGSGAFVKTLQLWAARRISKLSKWGAATSAAGVARDTTDAITGATARTHVAHMSSWTCTDTKGAPVSAGAYQICAEMNESNDAASSSLRCVPFTVGAMAWRTSPPDAARFKAMSLVYTPR